MAKKLSVISFDIVPEWEHMTSHHYVLTNSSIPSPSYLSFKYPFLLKGMIFGIHLRGTSRLKIDLKEYVLKPNTIFIILPNRIFESLDKSKDSFAEILFFSVDFMNDLPLPKNFDVLNKMRYQPCLELSDENIQEVIEYHAFISKACSQNRHLYHKEVAKSLLCALIGLIGSMYAEKEVNNTGSILHSRGEEIVDKFSDLLMQHHREERSASFYADKMCITPQYLSRTLKKLTGRSISSWINEAVILDAKVLLKSTDMTVLQVSEELNFPNPSFFGRFFKQYAGITPLKYKES